MGRVIFIGAGPGMAELITLRGARLLALADVVLFDALTDPQLRDLAPHASWIDVGKRGLRGVPHAASRGQTSSPAGLLHTRITDEADALHVNAANDNTGQDTINALLVKHAVQTRVVVRLKGGDPSIFGRLEEELEALAAAGIECEVVPGVTAASAAAAATRRPLTRRGGGRSVSLTTAMTHDHGLVAARSADTEVFYMAGKQLGRLARRLVQAGWAADAPASVVSRAGWPDQMQSDHTVASLAQATVLHAGRPTVVTVGAGAVAVWPHAAGKVSIPDRFKMPHAAAVAPLTSADMGLPSERDVKP